MIQNFKKDKIFQFATNIILIVLCLVLLGASFKIAWDRGNHLTVPNYRYTYFGIPVAVSYMLGHDQNWGAYASIYQALPRHPDLKTYNQIIQNTLATPPIGPEVPLIYMGDFGYADVTYFAFMLFGPEYQSIYKLICLLLFLSLVAYLIQHRNHTPRLVIALIFSAAYFSSSYYSLLYTHGKSGLSDPSSFGALLPFALIHFVFLVAEKDSSKPNNFLDGFILITTTTYQVFFIVLIWFSRASVLVYIMPVFILSLYCVYRDFRSRVRQTRPPSESGVENHWAMGLWTLLRDSGFFPATKNILLRLWPVLFLLMSMQALSLYKTNTESQSYKVALLLPGLKIENAHPVWHNIRFGLGFNRTIAEETGWPYQLTECHGDRSRFKSEDEPCYSHCMLIERPCGNSDDISFYNAKKYLMSKGREEEVKRLKSFPGLMDFTMYEDVGKEMTLDVFKRMPLDFMRLYLMDKPRAIFTIIRIDAGHIFLKAVLNPFSLVILVLAATLASNLGRHSDNLSKTLKMFAFHFGCFGVFVIVSVAPPLVFFPANYIMGDSEVYLMALFQFMTFYLCFWAMIFCRKGGGYFYRKITGQIIK